MSDGTVEVNVRTKITERFDHSDVGGCHLGDLLLRNDCNKFRIGQVIH